MMATNTNQLSHKDHRMKFITAMLLIALAPLAQAHGPEAHAKPAAAAADAQAAPAVKVVEEFSTALQAGDLGRAGALLDEDVLILESGGAERSKEEYLGGHAGHDAEFLKAAQIQLVHRTARGEGDFAWVGTESELRASKDGKPMALLSTETMVLKNTPNGWRIVHIHWSSRPKR